MAAITLTDLNAVMRDFPSFIIVPEQAGWEEVPLLKVLSSRINRDQFRGNRIELKVKTTIGGYAEGFAENQDIPAGRAPKYTTLYISLKEIIANAQLTLQTRNRAVKGDNAWVDAVADALGDMRTYFRKQQELAALGNGTAVLAECSGADTDAGGGSRRIPCDNTYSDLGVENTWAFQPGMMVDIYQSNLTTLRQANLEVSAVAPEKRTAANAYAAEEGTVDVISAGAIGTVDGDFIVAKNSLNKWPMGLQGIIQDGTAFSGPGQVATFQTLTRSGRPSLRSLILQAEDFGPSSENPSDGTPTLWALSAISDAITEVQRRSNRKVTDLFCHGDIAAAIDRLNVARHGINVTVSTGSATQQTAAGNRYAKQFEKPDGTVIPIHIIDTMPRHVLQGITADEMHWSPDTEFDFLRLYGDVWGPTKDDRKANFEAPFYGSYEVWANRTDGCFSILDLRPDV